MLCCGILAVVLGSAALLRRQLAALLLAASVAVPVVALAALDGAAAHAASFCGDAPGAAGRSR